ncbi:hypothetical protein ACW9I9_18570, partial [Pseudomonas pergaminensis]
ASQTARGAREFFAGKPAPTGPRFTTRNQDDLKHHIVGAGLPAMGVNDNAASQTARGAREFFAGKPAPQSTKSVSTMRSESLLILI